MVSTDNRQWQGFCRWLVAGFISPKHLQALSGCFIYQILSLQAGKIFTGKIFSDWQNRSFNETRLLLLKLRR